MLIPTWRPMPDTSELDDARRWVEAATIRARYRRLMAVRWRYPHAREEDARLGRLPQDWHEWMPCVGYEGYGGPLCGCDQWLDPREPVRFGSTSRQPEVAQTRRVRVQRRTHRARPRKSIDTCPGSGILVLYASGTQEVVVSTKRPRTAPRCAVAAWRRSSRRSYYTRQRTRRLFACLTACTATQPGGGDLPPMQESGRAQG